jgi:hypothetical protein
MRLAFCKKESVLSVDIRIYGDWLEIKNIFVCVDFEMKSKTSIKHRGLFIEAQKLGLAALRERARILRRRPR